MFLPLLDKIFIEIVWGLLDRIPLNLIWFVEALAVVEDSNIEDFHQIQLQLLILTTTDCGSKYDAVFPREPFKGLTRLVIEKFISLIHDH